MKNKSDLIVLNSSYSPAGKMGQITTYFADDFLRNYCNYTLTNTFYSAEYETDHSSRPCKLWPVLNPPTAFLGLLNNPRISKPFPASSWGWCHSAAVLQQYYVVLWQCNINKMLSVMQPDSF